MKNRIIIIAIGLLIGSCSKDFLDTESLTAIPKTKFWKTEADAFLAINGIYTVLQDQPMYGGTLNVTGNTGLAQYDAFGDNAFNVWGYEGAGNYVQGNADPTFPLFSNKWNSCYRGIGRANDVIANVPTIPTANLSEAKKSALLGQAYFLRALFYMELAIYYQDAPLILKVQTLDEAYVPKNTYAELRDQIIKDLDFAILNLPDTHPVTQYGYATRNAARGLLSRFQLYNKNYQAVVDLTTPILGTYTLEPNYSNLFTEAGESSKEILFSVRFAIGTDNNGEFFSATYSPATPKVSLRPMKNAVQSFYGLDGKPIPRTNPASLGKANRDPRLAASVYFNGDEWNFDVTPAVKFIASTSPTGYGLKKYLRTKVGTDLSPVFGKGAQDFIVIRYADILLMRAEALVELNSLPDVYTLVNQVRQRTSVNMPTIETAEGINRTQSQLRDIVRQERRVELMFEGLRFFDLKRWGGLPVAYLRMQNDAATGYVPIYRGKRSEIFAIPQSELDNNPKLKQNPDWE
jgi:starch-binding outer membrane protein, SusD/RagB family